ncbi:MAG: hypothetical protein ACI4PX_01220 [Ruminococcus sp.]
MSEIIISDNYTRAYSLDKKIKANAQILQETIFELGKSLLEMRDGKLYKELGYQNFAEYCENEVGIKRRQSYCYISIVENLPEDFVQSTAQIGSQKLYLLSRLDEATRNEIVKNTDISGTSVKELERQIKELKGENDKLRQTEEKYIEEVEKAKKELQKAEEESFSLQQQIDELENRPIEVAVSETESHEIENLKAAMKRVDLDWSQKYSELQEETTKEVIENNRKHNAEIEKLKAEYENKLKSVPVTDTKAIFKAYLSNAIDSAKRLMDFIRDNPDEFYISKAKDFYSKIMEEL